MPPKYPRSEAARFSDDEPMFYTWKTGDEAGKAKAFEQASKTLDEFRTIDRSTADTRFTDFSNLLPGISGRPGLTREGYNYFRPEEASPSTYRDISLRSNSIYQQTGLIKNVIDLMGDFTSQGVRLSHPNKRIEKWFNNWFTKVRGPERTERMANYLYRLGNVIVRKQTAKINVKIEDALYKTVADADLDSIDIQEETIKYEKREIPWRYTFLDPATVTVVGGPLASFVGNPIYAIVLPEKLRRKIMSPKGEAEKALIANLPPDIVEAAKTKKPYILDPAKTSVLHYKKDDWDAWAYPIIYSIFKDAVAYEKMKLADIAALDGAISNIRIFTIGDIEHNILPSPANANKLASILQSHTGGGTMDIIWTEDLKLQESQSNMWNFLGEDKYKPVLNALYAGLGIPPTLTGTYGAAGTTNNFISLKTLTERLEYGRRTIQAFWETEIAIVQKAMGFRFPANVEFDLMNLGNEDAVMTLYKEMVDRNIISDETMQYIMKQNPEMERIRINREAKDRDNGRMVNKTGPYFEPIATESLKKIALQQGTVTPTQVGMDMPAPKPDEKTLVDKTHEFDMEKQKMANQVKVTQQKMKGKPGQGRPKGKKDATKRKTKTFTPRSRASLEIWANHAQAEIADILNPIMLAHYGKKNMRMLSTTEATEAETIKFGVLCTIEPFGKIDDETVQGSLNFGEAYGDIKYVADLEKVDVAASIKKSLSLDDIKNIQSRAYADYYGEDI